MSKMIILNLAMSLDGYIADKNGGYDWIKPSGNADLNTDAIWSHDTFLSHVAAVVMGRRCYDEQMHAGLGDKQVYIVTSRPHDDYDNIHFISGDVCARVRELKATAAGDIYLYGGGISVDPFIKAGLIDEYIIGIIPIILGGGIPLFLCSNPMIPLHLVEHYVEDGIVILKYIPRRMIQNLHPHNG